MIDLTIRNFDDDTVSRLQTRAKKQGLSVEEGARQILVRAVNAPERVGDFAVRLFSKAYVGPGIELPEREHSEPIMFDDD